MYDLLQEIELKVKQLDASVKQLRKSAAEYAEAERAYKVKLRSECLKMRSEGEAIGIITLTCYGIPEVAELRFKRDIAEAVYKANQEAINSIKLQLRLLEGQLNREWNAKGGGV